MSLWDFTDIQSILQRAALDQSYWTTALDWINSRVEGSGAVLIASNYRVAKPQASSDIAEMADAYGSGGWHEKDMRYLGLPAMRKRGIMTDHDFIQQDEMRHSAFYQDFLRRYDREYFAGVGFQANNDLWVLSIQRTVSQGAFEKAELEKLKCLWRPMSEAATLSRILAEHSQTASLETLDLISEAAIILDKNGDLVRLNQSAVSLMGHMIQVQKRTFKIDNPDSKMKFEALIKSVLDKRISAEAKTKEVDIIDNLGTMLHVKGILLTYSLRSIFDSAAVLLLVKKKKRELKSILASIYRLTPSEIDIAEKLLLGKTVEEIAQVRNSRNDTVRMQLKSIFMKTGAASQATLVALLVTLV